MTLEYPIKEIEEKFQASMSYLENATNFENHVDKPWISENTLARWLYVGSKQVIDDFEKYTSKFEDGTDVILGAAIVTGRQFLDNTLQIFRDKLLRTFPEDKLIQEAIR